MPRYEYACTQGHQFEARQGFHDEPLTACPVDVFRLGADVANTDESALVAHSEPCGAAVERIIGMFSLGKGLAHNETYRNDRRGVARKRASAPKETR